MEKQYLSQEEIDALLGRNDSLPNNDNENINNPFLTPEEQDVICEIGNISVGSSSTALSELLSQRVIIDTPSLNFTTFPKLQAGFDVPYILVKVEYTTGIKGSNIFLLKLEDAAIIADLMMGGTGENCSIEMDELKLSAVSEAMNQMIGFASTSMSQMFGRTVEISPPQLGLSYTETDEIQMDSDIFTEEIVVISFKLQIGELLKSNMMLIMNSNTAKQQVQLLMSTLDIENGPINEENIYPNLVEPPIEPKPTLAEAKNASINNHNLDLILDIPLQLTVLLGKTKKNIADVLKITQGSIVELDRLESEPVDILVNNTLIAQGEVVVAKEYFGVRITNIISPENRIRSLSNK